MVSLDELQADTGFELTSEADLLEEVERGQALIDRELDYRAVRVAMSQLPLKYQEVLTLRYGENKKLAEIASILCKKEGTVKSLLSRALTRLKRQLATPKLQPSEQNGIMNSEGR